MFYDLKIQDNNSVYENQSKTPYKLRASST